MIDDNDQEMEVEDILASIKNILEEEQAISQNAEKSLLFPITIEKSKKAAEERNHKETKSDEKS